MWHQLYIIKSAMNPDNVASQALVSKLKLMSPGTGGVGFAPSKDAVMGVANSMGQLAGSAENTKLYNPLLQRGKAVFDTASKLPDRQVGLMHLFALLKRGKLGKQADEAVEPKRITKTEAGLAAGGLGVGAVGAVHAPAVWSSDANKILAAAGANQKQIMRDPNLAADTLANYIEGGVGLSKRKGLYKSVGEELLGKSRAMSHIGLKPPLGDLGATRHYKAFGATPTAALAQSVDEVLFGKTMARREVLREAAQRESIAGNPGAAIYAILNKKQIHDEGLVKARAFREVREQHHINKFLQMFKRQVQELGMTPRDALKGMQAGHAQEFAPLIRRLALDKAKVAPIYAKQIKGMRALPAVGGLALGGAAISHWHRHRHPAKLQA